MRRLAKQMPEDVIERLQRAADGRNRRIAKRAQIVLYALQGKSDLRIADLLELSRKTVARWRTRFADEGFEAIQRDRPRSGRKPHLWNRMEQTIIEKTLSPPPEGASRWSTRRLASVLGVSRSLVHRVWREHGLSPAGAFAQASK